MKKINVYFRTIDDTTLPILEKLRKERDSLISFWTNSKNTEKLVENKIALRDLKSIEFIDVDKHVICYSWDVATPCVSPENDGLNHLLSRTLKHKITFVCIDSSSHCKDRFVLFQDLPREIDYPKEFTKVPCFNTYDDFIKYAEEQGVLSFTLEDTTRFQKCKGIKPIKGASVYTDLDTGYYWYWDTFHKSHYEVFDKMGKHIGEANLKGEIDENKRDSNKKLYV